MVGFVIAGIALAVVALAWVLRPLWRGRPLLGAATVASLVCATALLYWLVGTPRALDPAQLEQPTTLTEAITRMQAELVRNPDQAEGWRLLGRALTAEGRNDAARDAFARAARLRPDNPDVLVEAAQASALADPQRRFDNAALAQLQRAVQLKPQHQRARWFLGIALRQRGEDAAAAQTWQPLLGLVDADTAASLRPQIDAARAAAGLPPLPASTSTPAPVTGTSLRVRVTLAPALAGRLDGDAALFVIAKQPGGAPMPVAVEKLAVGKFPREIVLDDSDSPMPTRTLSQVEQVAVTARISSSGNAMAQPGDLASAPVVVDSDTRQTVAITIDHVVE